MSYLEVKDLSVHYGRVTAVDSLSFALARGEVLTVLGRNGAGKSSLLSAIVGTVKPRAGSVTWEGRDITQVPADVSARRGMVMIPEGRGVFPQLTVRENLILGGFVLDKGDRESALDNVTELFPVLGSRLDSLAGTLSGGQQQILALGRALMSTPQLLLLDEPSLGLAPKVVDDVYSQLASLRDRGLTIILVEQHVSRALQFAQRAIVLNLGRLVLDENPQDLAGDPRLIRAYMGEQKS